MKTLLLMRHAKSSWDDKVEDDRDRSLSKRGRKNAERMGELLREEKVIPEFILSSSATRSRQTAELVMESMKYSGDMCLISRLYMAEVEVYFEEIQQIRDDVQTALIIGHSPALDSLLQILTEKVESLPTASLAHLEVAVDSWRDFGPGVSSDLKNFWRPKELDKK